jgi:hypothetical protein
MGMYLSTDSSSVISSALSPQSMYSDDTSMSVGDGYISFTLGHDVDRECSICLDKLAAGERVAALECMHIYHPDCIATWFARSKVCPECRDIVV